MKEEEEEERQHVKKKENEKCMYGELPSKHLKVMTSKH